MKLHFLQGKLLPLILLSALVMGCEPSHEKSHHHTHENKRSAKKSQASRIGPHQGKVVTQLKVNWELAGGKETRLYLLDSQLKPRALKAIQAELVLEQAGGPVIAKFIHAKDHLLAKVPYDPEHDKAIVTLTVNGKTEMIDFSQ